MIVCPVTLQNIIGEPCSLDYYNLTFCLLLSLLHGIQSCQSGEDEEEEEDKEKTFEVSFHKDIRTRVLAGQ